MVGLVRVMTWLVLSTTALAVPYDLEGRGTVVPPTDDSFYTVPQDVNTAAPGAILQHRVPPASIAAFGLVPVNLNASHQILYRTNDNFGNATATVLTVLIPNNANLGKLLSYQIAQDAPFLNCAPSYALQLASGSGGPLGTVLTQAEILLIEAALEQGWVVVIPDHQGPNAAFLANRQAGQATLDGIRAALNSADFTGIKKDATIAMWGYSGGSLASGWAAELQPTYAPELNIAGAAIGGTIPNVGTVLKEVNKKAYSGIIPSGILGLANQYPVIEQLVDQHIKPQFKSLYNQVRTQCLTADLINFLFKDALGMWDDPTIPFTNPDVIQIIADNNPGHVIPKIPLLIYKSTGDELSPVNETDALVSYYCSGGASVQYVRDIISEHESLSITGAPKALSWLIDIMAGKKPAPGCTTKTTASALLDLSALKVLPKILIDAFLDLLGKPVGGPPMIG